MCFSKTWVHIILILFQRTTFQAVLISGDQSTFVLMNYGIIASTTRDVQVRCGRLMIYRWPLLPDMMQEWMYYCRHKSFLFVHLQCMHSQRPTFGFIFILFYCRLAMIQKTPFPILWFLDHSRVLLQVQTQISA